MRPSYLKLAEYQWIAVGNRVIYSPATWVTRSKDIEAVSARNWSRLNRVGHGTDSLWGDRCTQTRVRNRLYFKFE